MPSAVPPPSTVMTHCSFKGGVFAAFNLFLLHANKLRQKKKINHTSVALFFYAQTHSHSHFISVSQSCITSQYIAWPYSSLLETFSEITAAISLECLLMELNTSAVQLQMMSMEEFEQIRFFVETYAAEVVGFAQIKFVENSLSFSQNTPISLRF